MNTEEIAKLIRPLAEVERELIESANRLIPGNKALVARSLGISIKTLYNKLNRYAEEDKRACSSTLPRT